MTQKNSDGWAPFGLHEYQPLVHTKTNVVAYNIEEGKY